VVVVVVVVIAVMVNGYYYNGYCDYDGGGVMVMPVTRLVLLRWRLPSWWLWCWHRNHGCGYWCTTTTAALVIAAITSATTTPLLPAPPPPHLAVRPHHRQRAGANVLWVQPQQQQLCQAA